MRRIAEIGKGHSAQVLLAEDEPVVRELIRLTLESYGYTVVTAGNGEEAFGLFLRHRKQIRVVITDWDMPRISGLQLRRMLLEERPDLPGPPNHRRNPRQRARRHFPSETLQPRLLDGRSPPHDAQARNVARRAASSLQNLRNIVAAAPVFRLLCGSSASPFRMCHAGSGAPRVSFRLRSSLPRSSCVRRAI